jgi:hypothetical protein
MPVHCSPVIFSKTPMDTAKMINEQVCKEYIKTPTLGSLKRKPKSYIQVMSGEPE